MSHFNVGSLDGRIVGRPDRRSVLTRSVEDVGIVRKDAGWPDKEEQRDGDGQWKGVQDVKVAFVGGEVAIVSIHKLGDPKDAPSKISDAGQEDDIVEGRPSVEESLAGRGVPGSPNHVAGSAAKFGPEGLSNWLSRAIAFSSLHSRPVSEPDGQKSEKSKRDDLEDQTAEGQLQDQ